MSSTNRGGKRNEFDYYVTPVPAILEFLESWTKRNDEAKEMLRFHGTRILDPCAGGNVAPVKWTPKEGKACPKCGKLVCPEDCTKQGAKPADIVDVPITAMSYPTALKQISFGKIIHTADIRPDSPADMQCDFLHQTTNSLRIEPPDIVMSNPPFFLAVPIIEHALTIVRPGGFVVMLQRLNFLGSAARKPFFRKGMPIEQYVHSDRMGFIPGRPNAKDSIEYAHYVWQRDNITQDTITRLV